MQIDYIRLSPALLTIAAHVRFIQVRIPMKIGNGSAIPE
jgi:hypothetical protein